MNIYTHKAQAILITNQSNPLFSGIFSGFGRCPLTSTPVQTQDGHCSLSRQQSTGLPSLHDPQVAAAMTVLCSTWIFSCFIFLQLSII